MDTLLDGRGPILTWVPPDAILEFNLVYLRQGKTRGNHRHPEFVEYLLVVDGEGALAWQAKDGGETHIEHMAKGMCARFPVNVSHAFRATTDCTCVAMVTKPWNDCDVPFERTVLLEHEKS